MTLQKRTHLVLRRNSDVKHNLHKFRNCLLTNIRSNLWSWTERKIKDWIKVKLHAIS